MLASLLLWALGLGESYIATFSLLRYIPIDTTINVDFNINISITVYTNLDRHHHAHQEKAPVY